MLQCDSIKLCHKQKRKNNIMEIMIENLSPDNKRNLLDMLSQENAQWIKLNLETKRELESKEWRNFLIIKKKLLGIGYAFLVEYNRDIILFMIRYYDYIQEAEVYGEEQLLIKRRVASKFYVEKPIVLEPAIELSFEESEMEKGFTLKGNCFSRKGTFTLLSWLQKQGANYIKGNIEKEPSTSKTYINTEISWLLDELKRELIPIKQRWNMLEVEIPFSEDALQIVSRFFDCFFSLEVYKGEEILFLKYDYHNLELQEIRNISEKN